MGDQRPTEMDREDRGRRPSEDIAEEQFLKDLYIFMSKRDTPIERLPHLGFKQLDLYLMYKTAKEMGGYHQVTAQQLWKQVYNALGGNPRSTSAATCTRRHYEKLLLPYECHVKGLCLSAVQQPRHYRYVTYRKMDDDGPPLKRRPPQYPLQNPLGVMPEHNSGYLPLSPSYHKFYYPSFPYPPLPQAPLPPPQLIAPRPPPPPPPPPQPQPLPPPPSYPSRTPPLPSPMECPPPIPISPESQVNPLEHLRYLAKQYENSAGFSEPLDLSKPLTRDVVTNPVSSFAPPPSLKNPKFLNKPSPLYTSLNAGAKGEGEDATDATDAKDATSPQSSAVRIDAQNKEVTETQLTPFMNKLPTENGKRMEIEIPLSVFNNWLQMYNPQAALQGSRQPQINEANRKSTNPETMATNFTFAIKQGKSGEGNSRLQPSQNCTNVSSPLSQSHGNYLKSTFGIQKNALSREFNLCGDVREPCNDKSQGWDLTSRGGLSLSRLVTPNPTSAPQDLRASRPKGGQQSQPEPISVLQLTPDEVMKLKRIISNSSCH
ncbi:unnamed protein product [Knipowitschia caucasica]